MVGAGVQRLFAWIFASLSKLVPCSRVPSAFLNYVGIYIQCFETISVIFGTVNLIDDNIKLASLFQKMKNYYRLFYSTHKKQRSIWEKPTRSISTKFATNISTGEDYIYEIFVVWKYLWKSVPFLVKKLPKSWFISIKGFCLKRGYIQHGLNLM